MKRFFTALLIFAFVSTPYSPAYGPKQVSDVVVISITQEFSHDTLDDEIEQLEHAIKQPGVREIDLLLNTPGGYVNVMYVIRGLIYQAKQKGIVIKTSTINYAASCGADIFMEGDVRVMGANDDILFHEMSSDFDGISLTVSEIREIVQTGTLTHATDPDTIVFMHSSDGKDWIEKNMSDMRDELPNLDAEMKSMDELLASQLGKSYEWVKANVSRPFHDTWFTGREALALGIATELDRS